MPHHHPPAVTWEQARKNLHAAGLTCTAGTGVETLPPKAAIGRYTADDVYSLMDVPHYDSSAMDGYAVSGTPPWLLVTPEYPDDERVQRPRFPHPRGARSGAGRPLHGHHRLRADVGAGDAAVLFPARRGALRARGASHRRNPRGCASPLRGRLNRVSSTPPQAPPAGSY